MIKRILKMMGNNGPSDAMIVLAGSVAAIATNNPEVSSEALGVLGLFGVALIYVATFDALP